MIDHSKQNPGFVPEFQLESDLLFGSNDRIKRWLGNTPHTTDWLKFYSEGEVQHGAYYDTRGCCAFSALKELEAVMNFLLYMGFISTENKQWLTDNGYFVGLQIRLSDRFTYHMSGTDPELGNTPSKVWWSIRNNGVVPETKWSWNRGKDIPQIEKYIEWFNQVPPKEIKDLGIEFKKRFDVLYEQIPVERFKEGIGYSPIQVFFSSNCPFKQGVQQKCSDTVGHAATMTSKKQDIFRLFDSYLIDETKQGQERFIRTVTQDYIFFPYGYMCAVEEKKQIKPKFVFTRTLSFGSKGDEVVKLQDMLRYEKFFNHVSTGNFGEITAKAVREWQVAHGLPDFKDEKDIKKIRWGEQSIKRANILYS